MKNKISRLGYHIVNENPKISDREFEKISKNLSRFDIPVPAEFKEFTSFEDNENFPQLPDNCFNYDELISKFAEDTCGEDIKLIEDFHKSLIENGIPKPPTAADIRYVSGWAKYDFNGEFLESVEAPEDQILVFDTETFVKGNNLPIIGTATGAQYSYIWICKEFLKETNYEDWDQLHLVPLPHTKIVIAHNSQFDVCRIRESYQLPVKIKALDTLSMHIITNGLCSQQRYASLLDQKDPSELSWREKAILRNPPAWLQKGTTNSLVAVYNFHVANSESFFGTEEKLTTDDKEIRDVFVKTESMNDFVAMGSFRKSLLEYAIKDTYYTAKIFKFLYPKYKESKPHIAALSGHLLLSTARVPLADNWEQWINNCEELLEKLNKEASDIFKEECQNLYQQWIDGSLTLEQIKNDTFLSQLDWNIKRKKVNKKYSSPLIDLIKESIDINDIPINLRDYYQENPSTFLKGNYEFIPNWYEPIFKDNDYIISPKTEISHLLLRLHYNGHPLYKHKSKGWGYWIDSETFEKVPSHGTPNINIGNVLAKSYIDDMQNGILTGEHPKSKRIFEIAIQTSFWISTRSRVLERFFVNTHTSDGTPFKMMCPQPLIHGK